jgi:hypothetical protein
MWLNGDYQAQFINIGSKVESNLGNLVQCTARRNIDLSVAGDQVIFQTTDNNKDFK